MFSSSGTCYLSPFIHWLFWNLLNIYKNVSRSQSWSCTKCTYRFWAGFVYLTVTYFYFIIKKNKPFTCLFVFCHLRHHYEYRRYRRALKEDYTLNVSPARPLADSSSVSLLYMGKARQAELCRRFRVCVIGGSPPALLHSLARGTTG